MQALLNRHRHEFARAVANHQYEVTDQGILFPKQKAFVGGMFHTWINGGDHQVDPNLIPTEGLNYLLSVAVKNSSPIAAWYVALFSGNYTPVAGITGETFASAATEFEDYDEVTRVEFVDGTVSAGSVSNSASKANFTISTGVAAQNLYGAALLQDSAKGSGDVGDKILAISRFASTRVVNATDVLSVQYTLSVTSS